MLIVKNWNQYIISTVLQYIIDKSVKDLLTRIRHCCLPNAAVWLKKSVCIYMQIQEK